MLTYLTGDATEVAWCAGNKIIAHVVNDAGGWGKGFVRAVSRRWPVAERAYRALTPAERVLGRIQVVPVAPELWVANLVAQHGLRSRTNPCPLDYAALERCLQALALVAETKQASVHLPRLGAGLAGGDWEQIAAQLNATLHRRPVYVYLLQAQE